jgi:hypothetical protein
MPYPLFLYELHYVRSPVVPGLTERPTNEDLHIFCDLPIDVQGEQNTPLYGPLHAK